MAEQNQRNRGKTPPVEKEWKRDSDSPIEQAKVHPSIHLAMKIMTGLIFIDTSLLLCYIYWDWEVENNMFDALVFTANYLVVVVFIIALSVVRVAQKEQ